MNKDVAAKYDLVGVEPGSYNFPGYGEIHLQTMTLQQADALVAKGFPYLEAKKPKKPSAAEDTSVNNAN